MNKQRIAFAFLGASLLAAMLNSLPARPVQKNARLIGDGTTDNSAALQALVNSATGSIRLPRGKYLISKPIVIDLDQVGLTSIHGDGVATLIMAGSGPTLRFVGTHGGTADPGTVKDNVWEQQRAPMVDGLEIVGQHAEACGIEATGTMQLTISRVIIRKALHGIHLVKRNRNVAISDCHVYENRGVGIFYDNVDLHQSNIVGCHVSYNRQGGIVVRSGNVRNLHVGTCDIEGNMSADESPTANILLDARGGSIGEVAITGCTIQHAHNTPDSANIRMHGLSQPVSFTPERRHGHLTMTGNVLSDVRINIDLMHVRSAAITGNTIWKGYDSDIRIRHCEHVVITGNMLDKNPRYFYGDGKMAQQGILIEDSSACLLNSNAIIATPSDQTAALTIRNCSDCLVSDCHVISHVGAAISVEKTDTWRVTNCLLRTRSGQGLMQSENENGRSIGNTSGLIKDPDSASEKP